MSVKLIGLVLPAPSICDNCGSSEVKYTTYSVLYGNLDIPRDWPFIYFCQSCKAAVGCHSKTNIPLGRMADSGTRFLRAKAHLSFDKIWGNRVMLRTEAYKWLAEKLNIDASECHLGLLTKEQLAETIRVSTEQYKELEVIYARREKRRSKRANKRFEREAKRNGLKSFGARSPEFY